MQKYLPKRSPDRADDQLHRAMAQEVHRHYDRGRADAGIEIGGDLRQQRIGHAHHGLRGKAGDGKQDDGADGAAAREGSLVRQS